MILDLPEADIPFEGVSGRLLQGEDRQIVEHKHGEQWSLVFSGEMELTIKGETRTYKKGDQYFIPAGVLHSATFITKTFIMDVFADKDRYGTK